MAALLTSTSMRPNRSFTVSAMARAWASSVTSVLMYRARCPSASISAATALPSSTSAMATSAPSAASARA